MLSAFRPLRHTASRSLRFAALLLASLIASGAQAALLDPETPDANPNLGLQREDAAGAFTTGHVYAIGAHPRGGVIVGGEFVRMANGTALTHLLRLRADGTYDLDFQVELSSSGSIYVNAIASTRDAIYIGGYWQKVNGVERPAIAKLDLDGNLVTSWHEQTPQTADNLLHGYDVVNAIAIGNGSVYVGGNIETLRLMGLAKLDETTGTIDQSYKAQPQTHDHAGEPDMGWRGQIHALLFTGTDLIVGGNFAQIGRVGRDGIARIALIGTPGGHAAVAPYHVQRIGGSGTVTSLAFDRARNQIYVGGRYFAEGGTYDNLMRTDATTGVIDASWRPNPTNEVSAIALAGSRVYYGGSFGNQPGDDPYLVRTSRRGNGATDASWLPMPNKAVRALLWQGGVQRLWIGGEFESIDGRSRNGLARISWTDDDALLFMDGFED